MKVDNGVWPCVARGNNKQNKLQSSDRAAITHIALFGDCTAVKKTFWKHCHGNRFFFIIIETHGEGLVVH